MLEVGGAKPGVEIAAMSHGDIAGLFRHYYRKGIGSLSYAKGRTVAQTERARYVAVVAHRQDTAGAAYAVAVDDHRSVVERGVLEKYILYQSRVDVGVDDVTALLIALERHFLPDHYQRACLGLGHIHAGVDDGEHIFAGVVLATCLFVTEERFEKSPALMVAELDKETLDLILKQYHQHKQSYSHKLIEDSAYKLEVEYLGGKHPHHYERKHSKEDIDRAALFHDAVEIEEQECHYGYVKCVSDTKLIHCDLL